MENQKCLKDAIRKIHPKLSIEVLAKLTKLTIVRLYYISRNPQADIKLSTMNKIYQATRQYYGIGLAPWEYLDIEQWVEVGRMPEGSETMEVKREDIEADINNN